MVNETLSTDERASHCQDCFCARSWKALGITEYTGKSLPEHIEELRAALVHSVSVIQTWHNMEIPKGERSKLWDIYWRNAPEMKQIREALRGDAT